MSSVLTFAPTPKKIETVTTIKLFRGGPEIGAQSTLRACYQAYLFPELEDERAAKTFEEYEHVLKLWEEFTDDPAVSAIDRQLVKDFRKKVLTTPYRRSPKGRAYKRTESTVNKIMRHFAALISPLWPPDRFNPGGRGYVPWFKFPEALKPQKKLVFVFDLKAMSALYQAAGACRLEHQIRRRSPLHQPLLWRTAMCLAINTGPRTWDLFDLRWEDIYPDDFRYGSIYYRARKTSKDQRPPLNQVTRIHLDALRALELDPVYVFPHFKKGTAFYTAWKRICNTAGVIKPFETFRKSCNTLYNDHSGDSRVGEWICGHGKKGVNAVSYDNASKVVLKAVYTLRLPAAFRAGARELLAAQGRQRA